MKTIDTKSLLIGLLFGICTLLALGAAIKKQEDVGRYEIDSIDSLNGCFVIDTKTGQLWQARIPHGVTSYGSPADWQKKND